MVIDYKSKTFEELKHCIFHIAYAKKYISLEKRNKNRKNDNEIAMLECVIASNSHVKETLEDFMAPEDLKKFNILHAKRIIANAEELAEESFQKHEVILMIPKSVHDFILKHIADDEYKENFREETIYDVKPK